MSDAADVELRDWPDRLERLARGLVAVRRVVVVARTGSTQDAARRLGPRIGDVVVAGRQEAGRGRRGRGWADTGAEGVALSAVVERCAAQRLAVAAAVGVAAAVEPLLRRRVGIRWPNDVVVGGRKLSGVLVEIVDGAAIVGIGLNVGQLDWPEPLAGRAVSLRQLGATSTRLEVLEALLAQLDRALALDDATLAARFRERDALAGTTATMLCDGERVTGRVVCVEPMEALHVEVGATRRRLPAATTTILRTP